MITPVYEISIPSQAKKLLNSLVGRKLVNMVRCNDDSISHLIDVFDIKPNDFFALCLGAILLYFEDGLIFGAVSTPHENTVLVWVEKNELGQSTSILQENNPNINAFYANDFEQWNIFLGQKIHSVCIIKEIDINNENPRIDSLPSERGIIFEFDNKSSLIISYGLNSPSYDTTIITLEQINPYFKDRLVYMDV